MTIEDVGQIAFRAIREEAMRCSGVTAERLGDYVRGVIQINNDIVDMLRREQFKMNSPFKGGYTHTAMPPSFIYADTDSIKCTDTDSVKEGQDESDSDR